jgi:hypothetical protein
VASLVPRARGRGSRDVGRGRRSASPRPHPRRPLSRPKSLEEFDFGHARGLKREIIAHLSTLEFAATKENVVFLGPGVIDG